MFRKKRCALLYAGTAFCQSSDHEFFPDSILHAWIQLAVSTRPNEYKAYTGFIDAEDGDIGRKAFFSGIVGARARKLVLHGVSSRHSGLAEADIEDDDAPLTPVNAQKPV
jgi:hypothetical protein